nr:hypothetical protein [Pandoravirus aubagnensis]
MTHDKGAHSPMCRMLRHAQKHQRQMCLIMYVSAIFSGQDNGLQTSLPHFPFFFDLLPHFWSLEIAGWSVSFLRVLMWPRAGGPTDENQKKGDKGKKGNRHHQHSFIMDAGHPKEALAATGFCFGKRKAPRVFWGT